MREVDAVEVAEEPVVIVMAVPPHLEGELDVDSDDMPEYFVHLDGLEKGEVGHIVELYEEADHVEGVDGPAEVVEADVDQPHRQGLQDETDPNREEGLGVVGFGVLVDMLV